MKKTKYLVAALLLMGATTTFTSCIDNDEPAGIEELRGAKAELIKAKAQVELANEAWVRAKVANQELLNQHQEITNKMHELELKAAEIDLKIREAKSEAELAFWKVEKQKWEQELTLQKIKYETAIVQARTEFEKALYQYDATKKYLAELRQVVSDLEAQRITKLEARVDAARARLEAAHNQVEKQYKEYFDAITANEIPSLEVLKANLALAEANVKAWEITIAEDERLLELARDFSNTDWEAEVNALANKVLAAKVSRDSAEHAELKYKLGNEYQAADKAVLDAMKALGEYNVVKGEVVELRPATPSKDPARQKYQDAAEEVDAKGKVRPATFKEGTLAAKLMTATQDSLNAVGQDPSLATVEVLDKKLTADASKIAELKVAAYESEKIDDALTAMFEKDGVFKAGEGFDVNTGKFSYDKAEYNQWEQNSDAKELAKDPKFTAFKSEANKRIATVQNWINQVAKFTVDGNGVEWAKTQKELINETYAPFVEQFKKDSTAWQIVVDIYTGAKDHAVVPSDKFNKAVKAYNTAFANLKAAAEKHNTAFKTAFDKEFNRVWNEAVDAIYVDHLEKECFGTDGFFYDATTKDVVKFPAHTETVKKEYTDATSGKTPAERKAIFLTYIKQALAYATADTGWAGSNGKNCTDANWQLADGAATGYAEQYYAKDYLLIGGSNDVDKDGVNDYYVKLYSDAYGKACGVAFYDKDYIAANDALVKAENTLKNTALANFSKELVDYNDYAKENYIKQLKQTDNNKIVAAVTGNGEFGKMNGTAPLVKGLLKVDPKTKDVIAPLQNYEMLKRTAIDDATLKAQLVTERMPLAAAKPTVTKKGQKVYGNFAEWKVEENRIIVPTKDQLIADLVKKGFVMHDAQAEELKANVTAYGSYGQVVARDIELAFYDQVIASADQIAPLKAQLEKVLENLKAEIAAEEAAKITPVVDALHTAQAAFATGKATVKEAKATRNELAKPYEAAVKAAQAELDALETVYEDLRAALAEFIGVTFKPTDGGMGLVWPSAEWPKNTEALVHHYVVKIKEHQIKLAEAQKDVDQAKQIIELFNKGEYKQAAVIEHKKALLEEAMEVCEECQHAYDVALADLKKFIDLAASK